MWIFEFFLGVCSTEFIRCSLFSGRLVSGGRRAPPKTCYFGRFCYTFIPIIQIMVAVIDFFFLHEPLYLGRYCACIYVSVQLYVLSIHASAMSEHEKVLNFSLRNKQTKFEKQRSRIRADDIWALPFCCGERRWMPRRHAVVQIANIKQMMKRPTSTIIRSN